MTHRPVGRRFKARWGLRVGDTWVERRGSALRVAALSLEPAGATVWIEYLFDSGRDVRGPLAFLLTTMQQFPVRGRWVPRVDCRPVPKRTRPLRRVRRG